MKAKGHSKAIPALLRLEMSEEDPALGSWCAGRCGVYMRQWIWGLRDRGSRRFSPGLLRGSKINASWESWGWKLSQYQLLRCHQQRVGHICVSVYPRVQVPLLQPQGACWALLAPEWEKRARREAATLPRSFLAQKRHLSTRWPKLFTTGH